MNSDARFKYFAYGSNLNVAQMKDRVGEGFEVPQVGILRGYKMVFDKYASSRQCGAANLVASDDASAAIEGLVYQLTEGQLALLDGFEGVHMACKFRYRRLLVTLEDDSQVFAYVAKADVARTGRTEHKPNVQYLRNFLMAKNKLSEQYYQSLLDIEVQEGGKLRDFHHEF